MDYILQLRKLIGTRPILLVGAAVLLVNQENQLLLMKRTDNDCWGFAGGAVEPGERVEDAAVRETFEETDLKLGEMELFGVFSGPELYYKYPNGDEVYNVIITYLSRILTPAPVRLNEEHSAWGWFSAGEIPADISPPMISTIEKFKQTFSNR